MTEASDLMRAAVSAAKRIELWSKAKRDYAERRLRDGRFNINDLKDK